MGRGDLILICLPSARQYQNWLLIRPQWLSVLLARANMATKAISRDELDLNMPRFDCKLVLGWLVGWLVGVVVVVQYGH